MTNPVQIVVGVQPVSQREHSSLSVLKTIEASAMNSLAIHRAVGDPLLLSLVPSNAVHAAGVVAPEAAAVLHVLPVRDRPEVAGVAAVLRAIVPVVDHVAGWDRSDSAVTAQVRERLVCEPVSRNLTAIDPELGVSALVGRAFPTPAGIGVVGVYDDRVTDDEPGVRIAVAQPPLIVLCAPAASVSRLLATTNRANRFAADGARSSGHALQPIRHGHPDRVDTIGKSDAAQLKYEVAQDNLTAITEGNP
nr:hypothetical protein [Mycobacterium paraense]